jgi:hypothetical protein
MVTHRTEQQYFLYDSLFERLQTVLAEHGVPPRAPEDYDEADLLRVARELGFEVEITREDDPPGWYVEITGYYAPDHPQISEGHHPNRIIALLDAFRYTMAWATAEAMRDRFDQRTRELLGLSAEEFMQKVYAKEVDFMDSRVEELIIGRPLGW